jgi:hypothetical protein
MCRSIKTLREPFVEDVTGDDISAAALQYVRKISGFRAPSRGNREAFDKAVSSVAMATAALLAELQVRPSAGHEHPAGAGHAHAAAHDHAQPAAHDHAH